MNVALDIAAKGSRDGNYQIGAVVADSDGQVVAASRTQLHTGVDPTAHAEILAIREAAATRGSRYLTDCYLYTTLEPCPMCTSAAVWAKMRGIVFGATQEDAREVALNAGPQHSWRQIDIKASAILKAGTPQLELYEEFLRKDCLLLMRGGKNGEDPL